MSAKVFDGSVMLQSLSFPEMKRLSLFSELAGLTWRRQPLLLHTNPITSSAPFKTGPTEHLGELTGKAKTLNFTQRKLCEAIQWFYILNSGTTNNRETEQSHSRAVGEGKTRDRGYTWHTKTRCVFFRVSQRRFAVRS